MKSPFLFIVVFWGERFRRLFLDITLASLLSSNNFGIFYRDEGHRLLFCTTREDWNLLVDEPIFKQLCRHMEPEFKELRFPAEGWLKSYAMACGIECEKGEDGEDRVIVSPSILSAPNNLSRKEFRRLAFKNGFIPEHFSYSLKISMMSGGHRLAAEIAFARRSKAVFLTPDMIVADGSISNLCKISSKGYKVILSAAVRFNEEGLLSSLSKSGLWKQCEKLEILPRQLMELALNHLHQETLEYEWNSPLFSSRPTSCLFKLPDNSGFLINSHFWLPMMIDFGSLKQHSSHWLTSGAIDGLYVHENFTNEQDYYLVRDSDEFLLVSLTPERAHFFRSNSKWWNNLWFSEQIKLARLRIYGTYGTNQDDMRRVQFLKPVLFHKGASEHSVAETTQEADRIAKIATDPPQKNDYIWAWMASHEPSVLISQIRLMNRDTFELYMRRVGRRMFFPILRVGRRMFFLILRFGWRILPQKFRKLLKIIINRLGWFSHQSNIHENTLDLKVRTVENTDEPT